MPQPHFLQKIFPTPKFSTAEQETIISKYRNVQFAKNDFLLAEGKTAGQYWFVESGFIRSFATDPEGRDISTHFYTTSDIVIDWSSFFLKAPAREDIQALTDCVCWQIGFDAFQSLFNSIETFREQGRTTLATSYFALKNHNISMIADSAKDRYKKLVQEKPQIVQNVSLKQIATYLGITDTSLSRIRKEITHE